MASGEPLGGAKGPPRGPQGVQDQLWDPLKTLQKRSVFSKSGLGRLTLAPSRHKKAEDGPGWLPGSPLEAPRGPQEAPQGLKISSGRAWKCINITAKHNVPSQEGDLKRLEMALSRNEEGLGWL